MKATREVWADKLEEGDVVALYGDNGLQIASKRLDDSQRLVIESGPDPVEAIKSRRDSLANRLETMDQDVREACQVDGQIQGLEFVLAALGEE